jgi:hypothetical protein
MHKHGVPMFAYVLDGEVTVITACAARVLIAKAMR